MNEIGDKYIVFVYSNHTKRGGFNDALCSASTFKEAQSLLETELIRLGKTEAPIGAQIVETECFKVYDFNITQSKTSYEAKTAFGYYPFNPILNG